MQSNNAESDQRLSRTDQAKVPKRALSSSQPKLEDSEGQDEDGQCRGKAPEMRYQIR